MIHPEVSLINEDHNSTTSATIINSIAIDNHLEKRYDTMTNDTATKQHSDAATATYSWVSFASRFALTTLKGP